MDLLINVLITRWNLNQLRVSLFWSTSLQSNHVTQFLQFNNPKWKLQARGKISESLRLHHPQHLPTSGEGPNSIAPMEVGDEGEEDNKISDLLTNRSNQEWHQNIKRLKHQIEGDSEELPGHAYENIGPLNSPPPGFTMPPKPRLSN